MIPNSTELQEAIAVVNKVVELGLTAAMRREHFYPETWYYHDVPDISKGNFDIYAGATKGVIVPLDMDFVIKFDYVAQPYCARECENYKAAMEAGLEDYFPYTAFLCCVDEVNFYIQERAECGDNCDVPDIAFNSLKARYESYGDPINENDIWADLDELDADEAVELVFDDNKLIDFIIKRHINDLHMANFGTIYGRNVIIDFSGYGNSVWTEVEVV